MKKAKKTSSAILAIYAVVLLLYVAIFLLAPFTKTISAWVVMSATVLSLLTAMIMTDVTRRRNGKMALICGKRQFKIALTLAIVQMLLGIILCVVDAFLAIPYWIPAIVGILVLGIAVISFIFSNNERNLTAGVETPTVEAIKTITTFTINMATIVDMCENEGAKDELKALADMFKYSTDPVSNDATAPLEAKIKSELAALERMVDHDRKSEKILAKAKEIRVLLAERNRVCQATKGR